MCIIIALNPTLKLSLQNIRSRAQEMGRDVEKNEVIDKFSNMYRYLKDLVAQFEGIAGGSIDLEDLNHGTAEEISAQYMIK